MSISLGWTRRMHVLQGCSDTSRRFAPTDILAHFFARWPGSRGKMFGHWFLQGEIIGFYCKQWLAWPRRVFCCSTGQGRVQRCLSKPIAFPIKDSRLLSSCFWGPWQWCLWALLLFPMRTLRSVSKTLARWVIVRWNVFSHLPGEGC
jgi:hypothetical protein